MNLFFTQTKQGSRECFKDGHEYVGRQSVETEGRTVPLLHDGSKYYLKIQEPTEKKMNLYPIIELTSPVPWDMQTQLSSLRRSKRKLDEFSNEKIKIWNERLGQIPTFIT
jgi:pyruvate/2-oxoglutarate/acetoin dehydrogenase E1 component